MAIPNLELIRALRVTAERLAGDTSYQWGHMGMCNCGHLAQSITGLTPAEIHASALAGEGDWEQQAKNYCPTSGQMIDHVLAAMFSIGLHRDDVKNLEKLSDTDVIHRLRRYPKHNRRDDVVDYMRTWADVLEEKVTSDRQSSAPAPEPSSSAAPSAVSSSRLPD